MEISVKDVFLICRQRAFLNYVHAELEGGRSKRGTKAVKLIEGGCVN